LVGLSLAAAHLVLPAWFFRELSTPESGNDYVSMDGARGADAVALLLTLT